MHTRRFLTDTYVLNALSGIGLIAAIYPFHIWPLVFVALVPFFYSSGVASSARSAFAGGCLAGVLVFGWIVYFSFAQIQVLPGVHPFTVVVWAIGAFALLFGTLCFACAAAAYRLLRSRFFLLSTVAGAIAYMAIEIVISTVFEGYYYGSLASAAVSFPPALLFAGIGGIFFVSFLIAWWNAALAEFCLAAWVERKRISFIFLFSILFLTLLGGAQWVYLRQSGVPLQSLSVAILQMRSRELFNLPDGVQTGGVFSDPPLQKLIQAAPSGVDLLIFPYSVADEVVSSNFHTVGSVTAVDDRSVGIWIGELVESKTTVMVWNTLEENGEWFSAYEFWKGGTKVSEYKKQDLMIFTNYVPSWLRTLGFPSSHPNYSSGYGEPVAQVDGIPAGGLICSELHNPELARREAEGAPLLIAAGLDAMFPGSMSGTFSITAARYRAAENNVSVIRANVAGPSAFIDAGGSIASAIPFDTAGVLSGTVMIYSPKPTLYARFGSAPLYTFGFLSLCTAWWVRYRRSFDHLCG